MRYQQQGYMFPIQVMLQPLDHFHIQMVGRFIHDQQRMLVLKANVNKCLRKCYPFALPAAQAAYRLLQVMDVQLPKISFTLASKLHAFSSSIRAECIGILATSSSYCSAAYLPLHPQQLHNLLSLKNRVIGMKNIFQNCFVLIKFWILFKQRNRYIFIDPNRSFIRLFPARLIFAAGYFCPRHCVPQAQFYHLHLYEMKYY